MTLLSLAKSLLEFLLDNWKIVLVAVLITACGLYRHALLNAEKEIVDIQNLHQLLTAEANKKNQQAKELSSKTAKEINDARNQLVESAQKNAPDLYKRRYGTDVHPNGLSGNLGVDNGFHANGVRNFTADNTGTLQADSTKGSQLETPSMDASGTCETQLLAERSQLERFLNEAAEAAVVIFLWNQWADSNGFPREK